jgi:hypothetical protein
MGRKIVLAMLVMVMLFALTGCPEIVDLFSSLYGRSFTFNEIVTLISQESTENQVKLIDAFVQLNEQTRNAQMLARGKSVDAEFFIAEMQLNDDPNDVNLHSFTGSCTAAGDTLVYAFTETDATTNTVAMELQYNKSADTLSGSIEFTYQGETYAKDSVTLVIVEE